MRLDLYEFAAYTGIPARDLDLMERGVKPVDSFFVERRMERLPDNVRRRAEFSRRADDATGQLRPDGR